MDLSERFGLHFGLRYGLSLADDASNKSSSSSDRLGYRRERLKELSAAIDGAETLSFEGGLLIKF